jgi:sugar lactone lactonase YvrE
MRPRTLAVVSALALVTGLALAPAASAWPPRHVVTHRLLVEAGPIAGANGIVFGDDGMLYVGSVGGREIVKMDPRSGRIVARFGPDQGFEGADDVALGPDGAIYYTALFTGEVGRIDPDGTHTTVATLPPGVNPITFSDDGRLFVGLAFLGDALYEVDPEGVQAPRLINEGLGLNAFVWLDGFLYAPRMLTGELVRIDVESGDFTVVADGFAFPGAVDLDPQGRLHVLEIATGRIVRVDPATGTEDVVATLGGQRDNMAFDAAGRLFVSDAGDGSIVQLLRHGGVRTVSRGGPAGPSGLAVLAEGRGETVYGADVFRLYGFDGRTGRAALVVDAGVAAAEGVAQPMAVGAYGSDLVLTSWFGAAVQVFDPATREVEVSCHDPDVPLAGIGFDDQVLVSELVTSRVALLDQTTCVRETVAGLAVPTGLATDGNDLWVADWALGTIFRIAEDGVFVAPTPVATGLAGPEGLAVAPDGSLLVVEAFLHRVSHVDLETGAVTPLVEELELGVPGPPTMPPIWLFDGIAVGPSGAIYVAAHGIHRFDVRR